MGNVNRTTIKDIKNKYSYTPPVLRTSPPQRGGEGVFDVFIDLIDLELIISHVIKKEREFVLAHPEYIVTSNQQSVISKMIARRLKNEPLAYILGEKEFYGLNFKVNRHTLIPRPETELMVELAVEFMKTKEHENMKTFGGGVIPEVSISERAERLHGNTTIRDLKKENRSRISDFSTAHSSQEKSTFWDDPTTVIDVGTGSGNIIISLAHSIEHGTYSMEQKKHIKFFASDISSDALKIAKQNARLNQVGKIKFLHGNLLDPLFGNWKLEIGNSKIVILANLPYLSKDIYNACAANVKKYEPKSALYSANSGLSHYIELLKQIFELKKDCSMLHVSCFMEISPEQKKLLPPMIKKYFPQAKIEFKKDLAQKWRVCKVEVH